MTSALRRTLGFLFMFGALSLGGTAAYAQDGCQVLTPSASAARLTADGPRVALVIGNSAYDSAIGALPNAANDALAVTETLQQLGFTIYRATDASGAMMQDCAQRMVAESDSNAVGLVYYSGHGIQIDDQNYLLGIDASMNGDNAGFVAANDLIDPLQDHSSATLIFLDACRNNPLADEGSEGLSVSTGRGLQSIGATPEGGSGAVQARGVLVAYSTSPNAVALDGTGNLSPFTEAFVRHMLEPGHSVQRVMSAIGNSVGEATDWTQTPWTRSSLTSELKLNGLQSAEEAVSTSENWARRSTQLLENGKRIEAIAAALKGLPSSLDDAGREKFAPAELALYSAVRARVPRLNMGGVVASYGEGVISADGRRILLVSGLGDGTRPAQLWDGQSGNMIAELVEDLGGSYHFALGDISPDGRWLAVATTGGDVLLGDAETGEISHRLPAVRNVHPMPTEDPQIDMVQFDNSGDRLLTSGGNDGQTFKIWDSASGSLAYVLDQTQLAGPLGLTGGETVSRVLGGFSDGDTLCLLVFYHHPGENPLRVRLGFFDLATNKFETMHSDTDTFTGDSRAYCSPDGQKMAGSYYGGNGVMQAYGFNRADGVTFFSKDVNSLQSGGFDATSRYFAAIDQTGQWTYFDVTAADARSASPHPQGYKQGYSGVYSNESTEPFAGVWKEKAPVYWDDLAVGTELITKAMGLLPEALKVAVEAERIEWQSAGARVADN